MDKLLEEDAVLYEAEKNPKEKETRNKPQREVAEDGTVTTTITTTRTSVETFLHNNKNEPPLQSSYRPSLAGGGDDDSDDDHEYGDGGEGDSDSDGDGDAEFAAMKVRLDLDDPNSVHVGLKVYTHKDVPVEIE